MDRDVTPPPLWRGNDPVTQTEVDALTTGSGRLSDVALRTAFGRGGGIADVATDGHDANNGGSWITAKRTVKAAVAALPVITVGSEVFHAGTVQLGPGEFVEDGPIEANREIRFIGANPKSDNTGTRITLKAGANKHVFAYTADWAAAAGSATA